MPIDLNIAILALPLEHFHPRKDSTSAMIAAALRRGHRVSMIEPHDLVITSDERDATSFSKSSESQPSPADTRPTANIIAHARRVTWRRTSGDPTTVNANAIHVDHGHAVAAPPERVDAREFDAILVRTDPPFDLEYIYATYWLEHLAASGTICINRPRSLRDWNEKAALLRVPDLAPPTLVTRRRDAILGFQSTYGTIVLKPLDGMGGRSIFQLRPGDSNTNVILDAMLDDDGGTRSAGRKSVMAQAFLPAYTEGDRRVLIVGGEPQPLVLNRIPTPGESRANLAAGGRGVVEPLSPRDREIAAILAPMLVDAGLDFVGLDVIGGRLTEINVTSPTGLREILRDGGLDIAERFIELVETRAAQR
ncbi:MAG: glutathione synthase [Thioalkalivibrionaceae bacterium]